MEVVPLALELGRCVDLVSHDSVDGLLHIFHPLNHLSLPHEVDILDERIVLLPERHLARFFLRDLKNISKLGEVSSLNCHITDVTYIS